MPHNRANRGFHYPRSRKTTSRMQKGLWVFFKNYRRFLKQTNSFYCIEKEIKSYSKNICKVFQKK